MTEQAHNWLKWGTPILAAITTLLEAGHIAHLFGNQTAVLIGALLTAIVGFIAAVQRKPEEPQAQRQTQQIPPPQTPGQPQKK